MMTVKDVSKLSGVSIRTLQYYDSIGLLRPSAYTEAGYRLYDDTDLERLQQIMLFKELEFPLKEIKTIMDSPGFDRQEALQQQIELLTLKMEHLKGLIHYARNIKEIGVNNMDFTPFDKKKIENYTKEAKAKWGNTNEFKEFEEKSKDWNPNNQHDIMKNFMNLFVEFGQLKEFDPSDEKVQVQVKTLHQYINDNFYTCSKEILASLGQMYAAGGEYTENIDKMGGKGTANFTAKAIEIYCR